MASLLKAVYLLIALSIAADIINLRGYWYNNVENGKDEWTAGNDFNR